MMKSAVFVSFCFCLLGIFARPHAQALDDLGLFAYYTLNNTAEDALGLRNDMFLSSTVYEGSDGIYINGIHPLQPNGSWARTYYMAAMTESKFAVQLDFKIDDLDGQNRCIVVCGLSSMYLGLFIQPSETFAILLDGNSFIELPQITPEENVWYEFTMIYDTVTTQAQFYLDGIHIEDASGPIEHVQGDAFVTNYNVMAGLPLNGNWRNLRIYGKEEASALEEELRLSSDMKVFPNPANDRLCFTSPSTNASRWRISNMTGEVILTGAVANSSGEIDVQLLSSGSYVLNLLDSAGRILSSRRFVRVDKSN